MNFNCFKIQTMDPVVREMLYPRRDEILDKQFDTLITFLNLFEANISRDSAGYIYPDNYQAQILRRTYRILGRISRTRLGASKKLKI